MNSSLPLKRYCHLTEDTCCDVLLEGIRWSFGGKEAGGESGVEAGVNESRLGTIAGYELQLT